MRVTREQIDDFLGQRALALVGVRHDGQHGFGNAVRRELGDKGYRLHVVHPSADRIGDAPCAHTLAEVAGEVGGAVLVTPPAETERLVDEAAAAGIRRLWIQQGAESPEALRRCEAHGISVVHGECILMFAEPTAWLHRAHRWAREVADDLPPHAHPWTALERKLFGEVAAMGLPPLPDDTSPVTEAEVSSLPPAARRYLRFMDVVGRPRVRAFRMRMQGRFFIDGAWVPCECAQYNRRAPVTRVFHMRLRVKEIVPTYVRDLYHAGHGRMLGRALDLVSVVDDVREEISVGECVTYLNDAVLMAPSMLLSPEVQWGHVDDHAFDLALTDAGRTVRARVFVDAAGAVTDFSTTDRFYVAAGDQGPPRRTEWRTPVDAWQEREGPCLPTAARAVWMLPDGPLPYAELTFELDAFEADPSLRP